MDEQILGRLEIVKRLESRAQRGLALVFDEGG
jgi:hypothetical protein